jgi:hypothetical protein
LSVTFRAGGERFHNSSQFDSLNKLEEVFITMPKTKEWAQEFVEVTNGDVEIQNHGKYYSCSYLLDMETDKYLVRMHEGQVEDIVVNPAPLDSYDFAIRASAHTWRKFSESTPPAMYHGIWAATFRKDMRLEGNLLVLMQNLRCFTRQLELLRVIGSPV